MGRPQFTQDSILQAVVVLVSAGLLFLSSPISAAEKLNYRGLIEFQAVASSSDKSWFDGGFSKLRYDDDSFPLRLGKAGFHMDYHATDTLWLRTLTTLYADSGVEAELIETYLNYRPVPRGPMRLRVKFGAFHLPGSLENKDIGWASRYSITPSVINSWIGEELRTIGAELHLSWPGRFRQSVNDFSLTAAIFAYNDNAGTILAYRGWVQHDRQTGLGGQLRLSSQFPKNKKEFEPFRETDDRPGFYVAASWRAKKKFELKLLHYDNRANPSSNRNGQNAWRTEFNQIAFEWELPKSVKIIGQHLWGETLADIVAKGIVNDSDYSASYLLLSRQINKHRISLRYEVFDVDDKDNFLTPVQNSNETGRSWMLAYQYEINHHWKLTTEWLNIDSKRDARASVTGNASELERQILATIRYKF